MGRGKYDARIAAGEEFTRAFWDQVRDVEAEYGVVISAAIVPDRRKGVITVCLQASIVQEGNQRHQVATIQGDYPNATAQALEAFLYSQSFKLARMIDGWATDQHRTDVRSS